ncbi:DNA-binding response regulator [Thermosediminibacter oceani]|uniref:Stage 0 sporulation protein A homolog n=1 Tax=Thermosediminibacter oceani (strain ATCC BAA-1034 / DSM 16646 / JW/IW-1228P) TaxID=555079 RepID=D9RY66_THEOJ|nr:DNA-binding response regulator [Thermosediminibacter oceani]ADL08290.1 two component transcriptional regulator, LuxR family [Thermosediminibacter oceani DSM 16646]
MLNILLIDPNNERNSKMLKKIRQMGHRVKGCRNFYEAVQLLKEDNFDAIIERVIPSDLYITNCSPLYFDYNKSKYIAHYIGDGESAANKEFFEIVTKLAFTNLTEVKDNIFLFADKNLDVMIIEPTTILRIGLKAIIESTFFLNYAGEAKTACDAVPLLEEIHTDVILIGVNLKDDKEVDACKLIKVRHPNMSIVIFCNIEEQEIAFPYIKDWADAILLKSCDKTDLIYAITKVVQGGKFIDTKIVKELLAKPNSEVGKNPLNLLTAQEQKVFYALALGKTNKEIASELYLSPATVRNYVSKILRKLNLPNRSAVVSYAMKNLYIQR